MWCKQYNTQKRKSKIGTGATSLFYYLRGLALGELIHLYSAQTGISDKKLGPIIVASIPPGKRPQEAQKRWKRW
jgi:hypothetical protein